MLPIATPPKVPLLIRGQQAHLKLEWKRGSLWVIISKKLVDRDGRKGKPSIEERDAPISISTSVLIHSLQIDTSLQSYNHQFQQS